MSSTLDITFQASDPLVAYSPYSEGDVTGGWKTFIPSAETVPSVNNSTQPKGSTTKRTRFNGSSLTFSFYGSTLLLYGNTGDGCKYTVSIDGGAATPYTASNQLLMARYDLGQTQHTAVLTVEKVDTFFAFGRAVFSAPLDGATRMVNETIGYADSRWVSEGTWSKDETTVPSLDESKLIQITKTKGASATLTFQGSAIYLKGNLMTDHGQFTIELDGQTELFNGTAGYLFQDALLFFRAGLDAAQSHTLKLTNVNDKYLDFYEATVIRALNEDSSSPSTSTATHSSGIQPGVIVGATLGALAFIVAITLGALVFRSRRRRQRRLSQATWRARYLTQPSEEPTMVHLPPPARPVPLRRADSSVPGYSPVHSSSQSTDLSSEQPHPWRASEFATSSINTVLPPYQ
ncbi:hypothetical protein BKA62DRAFT_703407 [Auriculariales sp. MPI-PUGE-AT-0066]|nr:hypothetical protein BKA62DRAFT_703407 [Auriculariales sp. MPI-PUGE-AT-0066]